MKELCGCSARSLRIEKEGEYKPALEVLLTCGEALPFLKEDGTLGFKAGPLTPIQFIAAPESLCKIAMHLILAAGFCLDDLDAAEALWGSVIGDFKKEVDNAAKELTETEIGEGKPGD